MSPSDDRLSADSPDITAGRRWSLPLMFRNIAANFAGRVWSALSIYLFVPVYVKLLGLESYGIVSFHGVLLGIALIADAGLSAAFAREVARRADFAYLRDLLCTMERLYCAICLSVAVVLIVASPLIATRWLHLPASISPLTGASSIALMGVAVSMQLAMSLYLGGLMGMQRQESANLHQILFSMARSGLVIVPLYWHPSLTVYFVWQVLVAATFLMRFRQLLWKALGGRGASGFRWATVASIYRFALGMLGMSIIAALNTQLDKLVTSRLFALGEYALFALASVLASAPSTLTLPVALAVLPRMTRLADLREEAALGRLYGTYSSVIALIAPAVGALMVAFSEEILLLWSHDRAVAAGAAPLLRILAVGSVFLALQLMPYHLSLAHGHNTTNLKLGIGFLLITPPLTVYLARTNGLQGAAYPWLVMNLAAALALGYLLTRRFLPGLFYRWLLRETLAPAAFVVASVFLSRAALQHLLPPSAPPWLAPLFAMAAAAAAGLLWGKTVLRPRGEGYLARYSAGVGGDGADSTPMGPPTHSIAAPTATRPR